MISIRNASGELSRGWRRFAGWSSMAMGVVVLVSICFGLLPVWVLFAMMIATFSINVPEYRDAIKRDGVKQFGVEIGVCMVIAAALVLVLNWLC